MIRSVFFLRVMRHMLHPIAAAPGQLLAVQPGHPTHTLAVLDATGSAVLRHRYVSDGALYGNILMLDPDASDGLACWLTPKDRLLSLLAA